MFQVFIGFVLKQFEYIEVGQFRQVFFVILQKSNILCLRPFCSACFFFYVLVT